MIEFDTTAGIGRAPAQVFSVMADLGTYLAPLGEGTRRGGQDGRRRPSRQPLHDHSPGRAGHGAVTV
jgi:hypothetical protein